MHIIYILYIAYNIYMLVCLYVCMYIMYIYACCMILYIYMDNVRTKDKFVTYYSWKLLSFSYNSIS